MCVWWYGGDRLKINKKLNKHVYEGTLTLYYKVVYL